MITFLKDWFNTKYLEAEALHKENINWYVTGDGKLCADAEDILNCTKVQEQLKEIEKLHMSRL